MNQEIEVLQKIYFMLSMILALYAANLLFRFLTFIVTLKRQLKDREAHLYERQLNELFKEGRISDVIEVCQKRLAGYPNDAISILYLGKAYFNRNEYMGAREQFQRLIKVDPSVQKGEVAHYLSKIDEWIKESIG